MDQAGAQSTTLAQEKRKKSAEDELSVNETRSRVRPNLVEELVRKEGREVVGVKVGEVENTQIEDGMDSSEELAGSSFSEDLFRKEGLRNHKRRRGK